MNHTIIGTAGHIDHGKTALLKALTGIDADRLPEEQARGMTIDLGFVYVGREATFIDVPGHAKFIKNMLAGASSIDLVMLVIAADDGIMPQTREHFEILKLLGIQRGIIVITKIDLVEAEWLEIIREEIANFVQGSFLERAPVLSVSCITLDGIAECKRTLDAMIAATTERPDRGAFRLWIDRVFTVKGIGTIAAGTVLSGSVRPGAKLELLPYQKTVRVRKLQIHNEAVDVCRIGDRAAMNIADVHVSDLARGDLLAEPGHCTPTWMLNVKLYLLADSPVLENRTRIRLHIGSKELLARVAMLNKRPLDPGESSLVQFRLEEPVAVEVGDRYIMRSYSPATTMGGGTILEVHPRKLKYLPSQEYATLAALEDATPETLMLHQMQQAPLALITLASLVKLLSLPLADIQKIVSELEQKGVVVSVPDIAAPGIVLAAHCHTAQKQIRDHLAHYHHQHPFRIGMRKAELKTRLFADVESAVYDMLISGLDISGELTAKRDILHLSSHRITLTPEQEQVQAAITQIFLDTGFVTPSREEVAAQLSQTAPKEIANVLQAMTELGELLELRDGAEQPVIFHVQKVEQAERMLVDILKKNREIRLSEFREMLGSTRKYTLPLLGYFDKKGITERVGDVRRLK